MKKLAKKILPISLVLCFLVASLPAIASAAVVKPVVKWSKVKYYEVDVSVGSTLNVRSGPGTSYAILGHLDYHSIIGCDGTDSSGTWFHMPELAFSQNDGWVSSSYLKFLQ